jgi:hypothetical protein
MLLAGLLLLLVLVVWEACSALFGVHCHGREIRLYLSRVCHVHGFSAWVWHARVACDVACRHAE